MARKRKSLKNVVVSIEAEMKKKIDKKIVYL